MERPENTSGADGSRRRGARLDGSDLLDQYFRDVGPIGLLGGEEETERARVMEESHVAAWRALLHAPEHVAQVVEFVHARAAGELPSAELESLRAAARALAERQTTARKRAYAQAADKLAVALRACDLDQSLMVEIVGALEQQVARGSVEPVTLGSGGTVDSVDLASFTLAARRKIEEAMRARNIFINANLRLVIKIAKRYRTGAMPLVDLIQEGNLGLIEAVKRFDYRRGCRFSTYAAWWIRHTICRAIAERGRLVRIPLHVADAHRKVKGIRKSLSGLLGEPPSPEQVAEEAGLELEKLHALDVDLQPFEVRLDHENGEGQRYADIVADPAAAVPFEEVAGQDAGDKALALVAELDPVEADILRRRFGIDGREPQTLREIASEYNLSRERIRQLEHKGLKRIRKRLLRAPFRKTSMAIASSAL